MVAIRINGIVTDDGQLIVQLPKGIPPGQVEIVIYSEPMPLQANASPRDIARAKLAAAGMLSTVYHGPEGVERPSDETVLEAGKLPLGARPSEELIYEDREEG